MSVASAPRTIAGFSPQISTAASGVNAFAKRPSRAKSSFSCGESGTKLQSINPRRVCWRGRAVRRPCASRANRSSSPVTRCASGRSRARPATSSRAIGTPSRRLQIVAAYARSSPDMLVKRVKSASIKRSINKSNAGPARRSSSYGSGGTRTTHSPSTRNASRVVASIAILAHSRSSASAMGGTRRARVRNYRERAVFFWRRSRR